MTTIVESLAGLGEQIDFASLSPAVVDKTKALVLDSLGCTFGGFHSEPGKIVRDVVTAMGGAKEATIIGTATRVPALLALWANGTTMRYLDFNDTYFARDPSHPSGHIALALALAERQHRSGRDLIAAIVLAYELHIRLVEYAGKPSLWLRGFNHATNVPYPAAAVSAWLLGLDRRQTAHALAIAGGQSIALAEIRRGVISMTKATADAKAAADGLMAALLAERGMTGPLKIFEGDFGYIKMIAGEADIAALTAPVSEHKILKATIKNYAIETMTLGPVEAALALRAEHRVRPQDIDRVVVGLYEMAYKKPSWDPSKRFPTTRESADHSFNYCVAVALLDGAAGPEQFTEARIASEDVRDLMARVDLTIAPELEGLYPATFPGVVTVRLKDGRELIKRIDHPIGHPKNPAPRTRLEEKFRQLAQPMLSSRRMDEIINAVWSLEDLDDIAGLMELLRL